MASLRRKEDSKFWFACFTLKDGTRTQRSTKETDQKKAQKIADEYERAARQEMTARQAQRVISELYRNITGRHSALSDGSRTFQFLVGAKETGDRAAQLSVVFAKVAAFSRLARPPRRQTDYSHHSRRYSGISQS
jgi:hypothetical protein